MEKIDWGRPICWTYNDDTKRARYLHSDGADPFYPHVVRFTFTVTGEQWVYAVDDEGYTNLGNSTVQIVRNV